MSTVKHEPMSSASTKKLRVVGVKSGKVDAETSPFCINNVERKLDEICVEQPKFSDKPAHLSKKLFSSSLQKGKENNNDGSAKIGDGILPTKFLGKTATAVNLLSPQNVSLKAQPTNQGSSQSQKRQMSLANLTRDTASSKQRL